MQKRASRVTKKVMARFPVRSQQGLEAFFRSCDYYCCAPSVFRFERATGTFSRVSSNPDPSNGFQCITC